MKCSFSRPRFTVLTRLAASRISRCCVADCRAMSRFSQSWPSVCPFFSHRRSSSFLRVGSPSALNTLSASIVLTHMRGHNMQVITCMSMSTTSHYHHTENSCKSLILPRPEPITPRFPPRHSRTNRKRDHGRTFPVQEHHAPQGPAGCPEVETVQQAGAGNHRCGQDGPARSRHKRAAARCHHFRPPGKHVEGLDRARGEEGERRRGRELRRDPL